MNEKAKQEEFLILFERERESLSRFARAMARNTEEAKDIIGDTVLRAYENFDKIKNKDAFRSYLFSVAARLYKRKLWRSRIFGIFDEEKAEQIKTNDTSPETKADVNALYAALKKLPEKQREAVTLFEISGFSLEEIRQMQGGSLSGVKSRVKRGRERLAELLGADETKDKLPDYSYKTSSYDAEIIETSHFLNGAAMNLNRAIYSIRVNHEQK